jgi:type II secretory pathway component PulF
MRADLMAELGSVCAGLGVALQWFRSFVKLPNWVPVVFGVMLAAGLWALGFDWAAVKDWQAAIVHSLPIIGTFVSSLLGGLYSTANTAAFAVTKGADPSHPFVPVTLNP